MENNNKTLKVEEVVLPGSATVKPAATEPTVTMTRSQLEALIDEKIKNRSVPEKPKRVTDRIARVRFHEENPVISYSNVREKKDPDTAKQVWWMDIETLDKDGKITKFDVPYLGFLNTPNSVTVQIKRTELEVVETSEGRLNTVNPNPKDDKKFHGQEVDASVVTEKQTMTVIVLDGEYKGREFSISSDALNS